MSTTMMTSVSMEGTFPQGLHPFPSLDKLQLPRPSAKTRRLHALVALIASLLALCMIVVVIFHAYVAWMLAYPYVAPLTSNPKAAIGLDYEDVLIPSISGKTNVSGWYVPAYSDDSNSEPATRTIVFSHGYGANREETWVPMYDLTKLLNGLHYNVMLFDYGYASAADKTAATGGLEESQQLLAAVQYVKEQGSKEVIVWGFSMGAGTALQAALQSKDINGMILDSLFVPSADSLFNNVSQVVSLPRFPSETLIGALLPLWTGVGIDSVPAEQMMNTSYDIPIYIIHGTQDVKSPYTTAEHIADKQTNPLSRSWIVQQGQHEMLFREHPSEYIQRAALFLSQVNQQVLAAQSDSAAASA